MALSSHVDTGSIHSWLSYEDGLDAGILGAIQDRRAWSVCKLNTLGGPGSYVHFLTQDLPASARSLDGYAEVTFKPRVVRNWRNSPLARLCSVGACPGSSRGTDGRSWCGSRRALVGRDILRLNEILLVFDSLEGLTYVLTKSGMEDFGTVAEQVADRWDWEPPLE